MVAFAVVVDCYDGICKQGEAMSWQEKERERYLEMLRERWSPEGWQLGCNALDQDVAETVRQLLPTFGHPTMRGVPKLTWSAAEIARVTGLSIQFIRNDMSAGRLRSRKYGRRRLVKTQDLDSYLSEGSEGSKPQDFKDQQD